MSDKQLLSVLTAFSSAQALNLPFKVLRNLIKAHDVLIYMFFEIVGTQRDLSDYS